MYAGKAGDYTKKTLSHSCYCRQNDHTFGQAELLTHHYDKMPEMLLSRLA
jgi:hypothetical protein